MFQDIQEAISMLRALLADDALLEQKAKKFSETILKKYSEEVQIKALVSHLKSLPSRGRPMPAWLPTRYVEILVHERIIRPYAVEGWPLKNSVLDFWDLLVNVKILSTGQRVLVIGIVLKAILLKYLTKPVRMIRKMRRRGKGIQA